MSAPASPPPEPADEGPVGGDPALCVPHLPRRDDILGVLATGLDERGAGTATLRMRPPGEARARRFRIHVPGLLPGEEARVRVTGRRRDRVEAEVAELLVPHPERRTPPCPHFHSLRLAGQTCGGCVLQQVPEDVQRAMKLARTRTQIEAHGLDPALLQETLPAPSPWGYRNKMEFSFGEDAEGALVLGLHPPGYRHEVLALERCAIFNEWAGPFLVWFCAEAAALGLRAHHAARATGWLRTLMIREAKRSGEILIEIGTAFEAEGAPEDEAGARAIAQGLLERSHAWLQEHGLALTSGWWTRTHARRGQPTRLIEENLIGAPCIRETLRLDEDVSLSFEIHPRAFFQPNTLQAERLYSRVVALSGVRDGNAQGGGARGGDPPGGTVLDLYCGTGTIALCLAPWAERVVGVELQPDAVENARRNAAAQGLANAHFLAGDVALLLEGEELQGLLSDVRATVVDPPRAGLSTAALDLVATLPTPRLVYVSCNPETLARDVAMLQGRGWRCARIEPVDMFPHTAHIENIALLLAPSDSGARDPAEGTEEHQLEGPG